MKQVGIIPLIIGGVISLIPVVVGAVQSGENAKKASDEAQKSREDREKAARNNLDFWGKNIPILAASGLVCTVVLVKMLTKKKDE